MVQKLDGVCKIAHTHTHTHTHGMWSEKSAPRYRVKAVMNLERIRKRPKCFLFKTERYEIITFDSKFNVLRERRLLNLKYYGKAKGLKRSDFSILLHL